MIKLNHFEIPIISIVNILGKLLVGNAWISEQGLFDNITEIGKKIYFPIFNNIWTAIDLYIQAHKITSFQKMTLYDDSIINKNQYKKNTNDKQPKQSSIPIIWVRMTV